MLWSLQQDMQGRQRYDDGGGIIIIINIVICGDWWSGKCVWWLCVEPCGIVHRGGEQWAGADVQLGRVSAALLPSTRVQGCGLAVV